MPIKLNADEKQALLENTEDTFLYYWALDTMRTRDICSYDGKSKTLENLCIELIEDSEIKKQISIADMICEIEISFDSGCYCINVNRLIYTPNSIKPLDQYENEDFANLLFNHQFSIHKNQQQYSSGIFHKRGIIIGGPGKIDLYRSHLVNLYNIIQRIKQDKTDTMLVALATGSGKTFTQALWLQVLYFAGMVGIFTMPRNLVVQFCKDMDRLLPSEITDDITLLAENDGAHLTQALTDDCRSIVTSAENLLDNCYVDLLTPPAGTKRIFLSFDEQHAIANFETRYKRANLLAKQYLSLYLTATPSQETYVASGSSPVAMMSPAQKKQSGQGQLSEIKTIKTEFTSDLNRRYTPYGKQYLINELAEFACGLIFPKVSSAAIEAIELLPYQVALIPSENGTGTTFQMPMARKMLWLIDSNESLVNFFANLNSNSKTKYYTSGALTEINAGKVNMPMRSGDDKKNIKEILLIKKRRDAMLAEQIASLTEKQREDIQEFSAKSLFQQVKENMLHGLIEYVLVETTGLSQIELNELRKNNLQQLLDIVKSNKYIINRPDFGTVLNQKVGVFASNLISPLLDAIYAKLQQTRSNDIYTLSKFCINDFLDTELYEIFITDRYDFGTEFERSFNEYCGYFQVVAVMADMEDAESPVDDSRPFCQLKHETREAFEDKRLAENAKKRKRSSIDQIAGMLGAGITDDFFNPSYLDASLDETKIDTLFKLGFIGIYVSNKKAVGFNDPNLHTVVSITENDLAMNANPTVQVQSYGRTRGLDPTVKPTFVSVFGRKVQPHFDLRRLDKDADYYPSYFRALRAYNRDFINTLSEKLTQDLLQEYHNFSDASGNVNQKKLKRASLVLIAKTLRKLNIINSFDIQVSRAQLSQVLIKTSYGIENEINNIKHPYQVSGGTKFTVAFVKGIFTTLNLRQNMSMYFKLKMAERRLLKAGNLQPADKVYLKMIRSSFTFGTLEANGMVFAEFSTFANQLVGKIPTTGDNEHFGNMLLVFKKLLELNKKTNSHTPDELVASQQRLSGEIIQLIPNLLINFDSTIKQLIEHFSPIIFHEEFIRSIDMVMGNLDESDVECLIYNFMAGIELGIDIPGLSSKNIAELSTAKSEEEAKKLSADAAKNYFGLLKNLRNNQTEEFIKDLKGWFLSIIMEVLGTILKEFVKANINPAEITEVIGLISILQEDPNDLVAKARLAVLGPTIYTQLAAAIEDINVLKEIQHTKTLNLLIKTFMAPAIVTAALNESFCYFHHCSFEGSASFAPVSNLLIPHLSTEFTLPSIKTQLDEIILSLDDVTPLLNYYDYDHNNLKNKISEILKLEKAENIALNQYKIVDLLAHIQVPLQSLFPENQNVKTILSKISEIQSVVNKQLRLPFREIELNLSRAKNMVDVTTRLDKVKQASSSENTSTLEYLKENVVKGVWWKLKYSTWKVSISRVLKNTYFAIKEGLLYIWRGIKFVAGKIRDFVWTRSKNPNGNKLQTQLDERYMQEFIKKLNQAKPITQKQTQERDCPEDALSALLEEYEDGKDSDTCSTISLSNEGTTASSST